MKLLAVVMVSTGLMWAQGPGPGPGPAGPRPPRSQPLEYLTLVLNLTDAQKEQARSTFDAAAETSRPLMEQLGPARQALHNAPKESRTDSQIDALAATVGSLEGQLAAIQTKAQVRFYNLLTTEQRDRLDKLAAVGGGPMGGPGAGPAGPPMGNPRLSPMRGRRP